MDKVGQVGLEPDPKHLLLDRNEPGWSPEGPLGTLNWWEARKGNTQRRRIWGPSGHTPVPWSLDPLSWCVHARVSIGKPLVMLGPEVSAASCKQALLAAF